MKYEAEGTSIIIELIVGNDWVDAETVAKIVDDLAEPDFSFYAKDNRQASIWLYLSEQEARALDALADGVFGLDRKPWWTIW